MGSLSEFPLPIRLFLRAYRWRRVDPVPWARLSRPLAAARLGVVSTAGFVLPGQPPFDETIKGGDWSFREIPADAEVRQFRECHRSTAFDHAGLRADPNLGFPLDRLRERVADGRLGALAPRHFSVMGSITAPGRYVQQTAPAIAEAFAADGADAVLVIPVCPLCNQTACLTAAAIERRGIPTVCIILLREVAEQVRPPRALFVPFRHGYPLEAPHQPDRQQAVLDAALRLLETEPGPPPVLRDYPAI